MIKYYDGCAVDELYNDNSGDACFIKFFEDGTVKSLYVGRFKKGELQDNTGKAWNIVYWEKAEYYVCNVGVFKNNHAVEHSIDAFDPKK